MRKISIISTHTGVGKTTVAINLAAGLTRKGYNVLIWDPGQNSFLCNWLKINKNVPQKERFYIEKNHTGINILICNTDSLSKTDLLEIFNKYDYILLDIDEKIGHLNLVADLSDYIITCTDLLSANEPELLAALDKKIQEISSKELGINLVVPCKIKTKEWDNNTQQLFAVADSIGYEKIADFIPDCEAIHDLPINGRTVWDLPEQYQNRKDAFDRLVERVDQDLKNF